jgi:CxxC-x17-CxxC domain-containing protein
MKGFSRGRPGRAGVSRAGDARPGGYRNEGYGGFGKRRPEGRFTGGFGRGPPRPRPELHKAVCAKCGQQCEVPFRPSTDKPVYCRECFSKDDTKKRPGQLSDELERINAKLDRILKALNLD